MLEHGPRVAISWPDFASTVSSCEQESEVHDQRVLDDVGSKTLHELVPKAVRIAVLVNPANATSAESTLRAVQEAAPAIGLQTRVLNATTIGEIDAAFATLARERPDALLVAGDAFFVSRAVQFTTLTARDRIPTA